VSIALSAAVNRVDIDIRSVWETGHSVFRLWFLLTALLVKPAVVWRSTKLAKSIITGIAMALIGFLLVAVYPVWIGLSGMVTELLLRDSFRMTNLAAVDWACPAAILILIATVIDVLVLSMAFKQEVRRELFLVILVADGLCVFVAGYVMMAYVAAHPAVA
jgi:hypothetical protein